MLECIHILMREFAVIMGPIQSESSHCLDSSVEWLWLWIFSGSRPRSAPFTTSSWTLCLTFISAPLPQQQIQSLFHFKPVFFFWRSQKGSFLIVFKKINKIKYIFSTSWGLVFFLLCKVLFPHFGYCNTVIFKLLGYFFLLTKKKKKKV